jgi:hypothetical protein
MISWDGSDHDWLEGRGPRLCLMGAIDDATGEVLLGISPSKRALWGVLQDRLISDTPSDHTQRLDLCALHYVRKVYKNHTVRLNGRVIDILKRPDAARATYAGTEVVVKHLLSGDYRVLYGEECIAWASGSRPKPSTSSNKNNDTNEQPG